MLSRRTHHHSQIPNLKLTEAKESKFSTSKFQAPLQTLAGFADFVLPSATKPLSRSRKSLSHRQMNATASAWILEFLLRQPNLDPLLLRRLISSLPVTDRHPRLLKTILLRSISEDVSSRSLSESTLDSLETIEDLDYAAGIRIPASMQAAYAAVAVACTAGFLNDEPSQEGAFVEAVNRIWKCRVSDMEEANCRAGLVSKELAEAKKAMLTAVWKRTKRDQFRARDTMKEALDLVRVYLDQALEGMGPSFLERAAAEVFRMKKASKRDLIAGMVPDDSEVVVVEDGSNGEGIDRRKVADEATKDPSTERDRHVGSLPKTADIAGISNKYDILPTPAVAKVLKDLRSSSEDLHTVVEDPLPDALEMAAGILADMEACPRETGENQSNADVDAHNASTEKGADVRNGRATSTGDHQGGTSFPGFMARNRTARTHEWDDDSIENPSDKSPNQSMGIKLPSPKKRQSSPLKKGDASRLSKRRKIKKWSPQEEETLRKAVKEFGKGHWKAILTHYHKDFNDRTEIDLKDKWRNMTRG